MIRALPAALALLSALLPLPARAADAPAAGANLVRNGDFSDPTLAGWSAAGDSASVTQSLEIIRDQGNPCARLRCTRFVPGGPSAHAMLAQSGVISLRKGALYEFSCRVRADNLAGRSVSLAISDTRAWQNCGLDRTIRLTGQWQTFRAVFRATRDVVRDTRLQFWFNETGDLYLDDVRLVELTTAQVALSDAILPTSGKNLLPNGSFEVGPTGWSSLGTPAGWGNFSRLQGQVIEGPAPHGKSFLRIPLASAPPRLIFDYPATAIIPQRRLLAANIGWVRVEPGVPYTLSCVMRASADGATALLAVGQKDPLDASVAADMTWSRRLPVARHWKALAFTFTPRKPWVFIAAGADLDPDVRADIDLDAVQLEKSPAPTLFEPRTPVEIAVEPSAPSGIFLQGQPAQLLIRAVNHSAASQEIRLRLETADFFDRRQPLSELPLRLEPGATVLQRQPLGNAAAGYQRISATWTAGGADHAQLLRCAFVPPRPAAERDSILGINHAFSDPYLIDLSRMAGVTWYRTWALRWQAVEPNAGRLNWADADQEIARTLGFNLNVLPLLPPFPSAQWCSEAPPATSVQGYPGIRAREAWAPTDPARLAQFMAAAAARYQDRIATWEFLNEPVYTDYSLPGTAGPSGARHYTPADYVRLLASVAPALRKAAPAGLLLGGTSAPPGHITTRQVIEAGVLKQVDILNLHEYPTREPEAGLGAMDQLLTLMDRHGGRKPIWITEFSYYGADDLPTRPFLPATTSWAHSHLLESERQCAEFTIRYCALMLSRNVRKIFIHAGTAGTVNQYDFECCLFMYGGAPTKSFPALAVFTRLLGPKPEFVAERVLSPSARCLAFETGDQSLLIAWDPADAGRTLPIPPGARCQDLVGGDLKGPSLRLSGSPVYILGPSGSARAWLNALPR